MLNDIYYSILVLDIWRLESLSLPGFCSHLVYLSPVCVYFYLGVKYIFKENMRKRKKVDRILSKMVYFVRRNLNIKFKQLGKENGIDTQDRFLSSLKILIFCLYLLKNMKRLPEKKSKMLITESRSSTLLRIFLMKRGNQIEHYLTISLTTVWIHYSHIIV